MPAMIDLTGQKYGRLTVLRKTDERGRGANWECLCECGATVVVRSQSLRTGNTRSCGCLHREVSKAIGRDANRSHGMAHTRVYRIWVGMHSRCENENVKGYKNYGGRGISVCQEWKSFQTFIEDMGMPPKGTSIDRINVDQGYRKDNCRWADRRTQQNNTTKNRIIEHDGKSMTLASWARETGINQDAIYGRLKMGWSIERALTTPLRVFAKRVKAHG